MPERQSAITPTREERRLDRRGSSTWASPVSALQRFADQIDRMFDDFGLGRRWRNEPLWRETGADIWAPAIDVVQKNNELTIKVDLPGLKKDEVSAEVTDDAVIIHGERKREREEEDEGRYRIERSYGSFYRAIPLPEGAITEQAKASFRDGVLEVTMPAPPSVKGRRLEIAEGTKK